MATNPTLLADKLAEALPYPPSQGTASASTPPAAPAAPAAPAPKSDAELTVDILTALDKMLASPDSRQPEYQPAGKGEPYPFRPRTVREVSLTPREVIAAIQAGKAKKWQEQLEARYRWGLNNPRAARPVSAFRLALAKARQGYATIPGFELDAHFRRPFWLFCLYFAGDPRFEQAHPSYSLDKGLGILGPTGPGKTTLFELFMQNPRAGFDIVAATDLEAVVVDAKTGGEGALDKFARRPVMIDDVGEEHAEAYRQYAKRDEAPLTPFASFVSKVDRAQRRGLVARGSFHFTTNLPVQYREGNSDGITAETPTLKSRYEARAASRLNDLVNFIAFAGDAPDRRYSKRNAYFSTSPTNPSVDEKSI